MALTFFKTPKNKKFHYKPVYYDQKKEEREKLFKPAVGEDTAGYEDALRERMRMRWKRNTGNSERKTSRQRLIIILAVILLLAYLLFSL
jgi:cytochrome c-type biogenesis protein CcmH/NrfG